MTSVRVTELPKWDVEAGDLNDLLYIVDISEDLSYNRGKCITIGDLLQMVGTVVKCPNCGQNTRRDGACEYCGGPVE